MAFRPHYRHRRLARHRRGDLPPARCGRPRRRCQLRRRRQSRGGDRRGNQEVGRAGAGVPGRCRGPGSASPAVRASDESARAARRPRQQRRRRGALRPGRGAGSRGADAALCGQRDRNHPRLQRGCASALDQARRERRVDRQHIVDRGEDLADCRDWRPMRRPKARSRASPRVLRPRSGPRASGSMRSRPASPQPT